MVASHAALEAPSATATPPAATASSEESDAPARVERVLAVHDPRRGEQHLVREWSFDGPVRRVDMLLATPSRPELVEIAETAGDPFRALDEAGALEPGAEPAPQGFGGVRSVPERRRLATQPRRPVHSTTLAPGDRSFFETELRASGFEITPATSRWLERVSARRLHVTALRFEATPQARPASAEGLPSALVHLRFESSMPFLPYDEPEADDPSAPRLSAVWLVSRSGKLPVALRGSGERAELVRPLREVARHDVRDAKQLADALARASWRSLVPAGAGPWVVQRFDDQKRHRVGFGDVVFLPKASAPLDDAAWERQRDLARLLQRGGSVP